MVDLIRALMQETQVIAPVVVGRQTAFKPITSPDEVQWTFANSTVPPTEYLLPQSESLFQFERRGSDVDLTYNTDDRKRTIIGIRPCDVHGLRMMDTVFTGKYPDPYYITRRKQTTLISMMCTDPEASCFCTSFNTGPSLEAGAGADLLLIEMEDTFYVRVLSDQGQSLIDAHAALFTPATDEDTQTVATLEAAAAEKVTRKLDMDGLPEALAKMFDSPYWDKISRKCIACGACTYLCPVCYCFDVSETCSREKGERTRCWDACTFKSFALLSGGHNPRPTIAEGYRQKMYHKFSYAVQRYDEPLCVGCGRCMDSCPVNLDIVQVLTEAKGVV